MNAELTEPSKKPKKNCCDKLTRTELFLSITLIGMIGYLVYIHRGQSENAEPIDYATPSYYQSVIEIQAFIDESSDPCEDFHQFVCGNFFENAYKTQVTAKIIQEQRVYNHELEAMIVQPITGQDSKEIYVQKLFFQACVDVEKNDKNHDKIILDLIDEIGGWPLRKSSNWVEKNFDWLQVMLKCKQLGLPFQWFLEFGIYEEDLNYLQISHPLRVAKAQRTTMEQIISGLLRKKVNAKEIFDFDQRLGNIIRRQKSEIKLFTIGELQAQHSLFDWLDFINNITGHSFDEDTLVASNVQQYFIDLYQLLNGTPKSTQANYIAWKIVEHFAPYLSSNVRKYGLLGAQNISRIQFCKENTKKNFQYFAEIEYVRKYVTEEIETVTTELTDLVRQEILKRVEESPWRNSSLSRKVIDVLGQAVDVNVGLALVNKDVEFLDANFWHIGNLEFDSDNPNITEIITKQSKCFYESLFSNLNTTVIQPEIKDFLLDMDVHIIYNSSLKRMIIPPSMLHGFLFDTERPNYLNFASLGSLIAKDLIKSVEIDIKRCLEVDYLQIMGDQTTFKSLDVMREVLPDIMARHIAYSVYQNWVTTNGDEGELPLLPYSQNQLFWIKSSLINCHKKLTDVEDESDFNLMVSKYKNVLAVRHSRHFAEDFSCPENTTMNPKKKCYEFL